MKVRFASYLLLFCVAALLAIGLVAIYSVGMTHPKLAVAFSRQLLWAALGAGAFAVIVLMPYDWLRRYAFVWFGLGLLLLALVAIPGIGKVHGGARRWLDFGPMNFQPSEFAKLGLILALAAYAQQHHRLMRTFRYGILTPALVIGPMLGLIFIEPDRGTALLLAALCALMLVVGGIRLGYVWGAGLLGAVGAVAYFMHDKLVIKRLAAWWYLEEFKDNISYQAYQAMLAFGQGGVFGLGLGNGLQKRGFVPENHTDFILSIVGEELGLVGAVMVVLLFAGVVWSGFTIARHASDHFGMLVATGISSLIGLQAVINIGVVTSAFPCKGLALPFVSYGGSSLMMMLACTGVLYTVARHAHATDSGGPGLFADDEGAFLPAT